MAIICPHCRHRISGYDKDHDQRMLELGRCVDCGADKTPTEITAGNWRCFRCRQRRSFRMASKRGTKNECAVRHIYAK